MATPKPAALEDAIVYIHSNYMSSSLTAANVCDAVFISKTQLLYHFKKHYGAGIKSYILQVRLEASIPLLLENRLSIATIAKRVGFARAAQYSQAFSEYYGCSPRQYRNR